MPSPEARCYYPKDVDIVSVVSLNITKDNLPGPGRILGNGYNSLGRRLEGCLNWLAERRGSGPKAVLLRVLEREKVRCRREDYHSNLSVPYTQKEAANQRKDVNKLIRYASSRTESTRKLALESIIDCARQGDFVLSVFKEAGAADALKRQEAYIYDFCSESVQVASRMALNCVQERGPSTIVKQQTSYHRDAALMEVIRKNPEHSFLAFRLHVRYVGGFYLEKLEQALEETEKLIVASPQLVEWEAVDKLFESWFASYYDSKNRQLSKKFPMLIWHMCRSEVLLPRTFQSGACKTWIADLHNPRRFRPYLYLAELMSAAAAEGISAEDIVCHNMAPSIQSFLSPPDLLLCWIAHKWGPEGSALSADVSFFSEDLARKYKVLAELADSNDISIRRRAALCIRAVLDHDIYSRTRTLEALPYTDFAQSNGYMKMVMSTGHKKHSAASLGIGPLLTDRTIYRHCDRQGNLLHVSSLYATKEFELTPSCTDACHAQQLINLHETDVLLVKFRGTPIQVPAWATPILAGQYADGQKRFIAEAYYKEMWICYCDASEGTRPEVSLLFDRLGKPIVPDMFGLVVLRHAPHVYPNLVFEGPNGERTMDTTGDLTGFAADVTCFNDGRSCRSDSSAPFVRTTELA